MMLVEYGMRFSPTFLVSSALLTLILLPVSPARAQPVGTVVRYSVSGGIDTPSKSTTFPMQLRGNHIYVDALVNGKPARMIIDNGASVNVFTPQAAQRLGLVGTFKASGEGATTVESSGTVVDTIAVGAATIDKSPAFIVSLPDEADCDGFLGAPLFGLFTVTLDYAGKTVTLAEPRAGFTVPGALSLPLRIEDNLAIVEATVAGIKGRFQTDTGNKGTLILFAPFVAKHHLQSKFTPRLKTVTGQGLGGFLYGELTRIPSLTLGDKAEKYTLEKLDGELSSQTSGGFYSQTLAGNLGGEILSRFTATFDYAHKRLFLQKNPKFGSPFVGNRSGLGAAYSRQDGAGGTFKVIDILPGSPAEEAGLAVGDVIVGVDGQATGTRTPQETRARFRQPVGTKVRLDVIPGAGGAHKTVTLTLRDLL